MKHFLILSLFLVQPLLTISQKCDSSVFILKDDASPYSCPTKHMWVGLQTMISFYHGLNTPINLWTNNGTVSITEPGNFAYWQVIPSKSGKVNIYSIEQTNERCDTILICDGFTAIEPPKISLKVVKDNYLKDQTITIAFVNTESKKPLNKRYQVGRMYEPTILNLDGKFIGRLFHCFGETIDFKEVNFQEINIKRGYKIRIALYARDMKTNLLIPAKPLIYTVK